MYTPSGPSGPPSTIGSSGGKSIAAPVVDSFHWGGPPASQFGAKYRKPLAVALLLFLPLHSVLSAVVGVYAGRTGGMGYAVVVSFAVILLAIVAFIGLSETMRPSVKYMLLVSTQLFIALVVSTMLAYAANGYFFYHSDVVAGPIEVDDAHEAASNGAKVFPTFTDGVYGMQRFSPSDCALLTEDVRSNNIIVGTKSTYYCAAPIVEELAEFGKDKKVHLWFAKSADSADQLDTLFSLAPFPRRGVLCKPEQIHRYRIAADTLTTKLGLDVMPDLPILCDKDPFEKQWMYVALGIACIVVGVIAEIAMVVGLYYIPPESKHPKDDWFISLV
eukprot:tig00000241_g20937.t1